MNRILVALLGIILVFSENSVAQRLLEGRVTTTSGDGIGGASVKLVNSGIVVHSDSKGSFEMQWPSAQDTLLISHLGYHPSRFPVGPESTPPLLIQLVEDQRVIEEVEVNTGYYTIPKERATGSFTHIDNEMLNRSVGMNIMDRLENITSGLLFDRRSLEEENIDGEPELRIRGINTIESDSSPLIVVDNFPFEGDISSINPADVQDITVLRDAAAASIWGARAGNGVIVINMKEGRYNRPVQVTFNSNINVSAKPDLYYNQNVLPAATVMQIEKDLFLAGAYPGTDLTLHPNYVELLMQQRDGLLSDEEFAATERFMQQSDLRSQSLAHLYRQSVNQQYALNVNGGGSNYHYALSAGYDENLGRNVGNSNHRMNISLRNAYRILENLEVNGSIYYSRATDRANGVSFNRTASIYEALTDENGKPRHIDGTNRYREKAADNGLLDWLNRPLDNIRLEDHTARNETMRLNGGINYRFLTHFNVLGSYQYTLSKSGSEDYYDKDSYLVRSLVNQFTQANMSRVIPHNGIKDYNDTDEGNSHSGRLQVNFQKSFAADHELTALAGAEIRQSVLETKPGIRIYNFDSNLWTGTIRYDYQTRYPTLPSGSARIPYNPSFVPDRILNRSLSYFANSSYAYRKKYILSGSIRWDGSNLIGVKANQRGIALWSVGGSWELSAEDFYGAGWLPYLRLRTTYGSAGNIDKSQSHYPTIDVGTNFITGFPQSTLRSPGNPSLRWEQVNTLNLGVDWKSTNRRIAGSVEYYSKWANHLLGESLMDPTTGVGLASGYKKNYASMQIAGWDLQINSRNTTGPIEWETGLLVSISKNRVTAIKVPEPLQDSYYIETTVWEEGESVDKLYAVPWYGLRSDNGLPVIYVDGVLSDDYGNYWQNLEKSDLIMAGLTVPPLFGSVRNMVRWQGIQIDFIIAFKTGHVFRRNSIAPGQEYLMNANRAYHMDYFERWKQPGDELHTDVPAGGQVGSYSYLIDNAYKYSEALITKGDAVRLQDVRLSYTLDRSVGQRLPFSRFTVFGYARNLGVLWQANNNGIDPEYPNTGYPAPRSFAVGLQVAF